MYNIVVIIDDWEHEFAYMDFRISIFFFSLPSPMTFSFEVGSKYNQHM